MKRTASHQILPVVPLKPISRPATPKPKDEGKDEKDVEIETPTRMPRKVSAVPSRIVPQSVPVDDESSRDVVLEDAGKPEPAPQAVDQKVELAGENAPSLTRPTQKVTQSSQGPAAGPTSETEAAPATPSRAEITKSEGKTKKHPGKLDISAAVDKKQSYAPSIDKTAESATPAKTEASASQPQSAVSKPESPVVSSPATRAAPRTLRVLPTPKTDTPPSVPAATPKEAPAVAATRLPSRQPSLASINPPGTPSSEQISISDNVSTLR